MVEVVTLDDPAIDLARSNLLEYSRTRNIDHLVFKDELEPVYFILQRLSTDMLLRLREFGKGDKVTYSYLVFLAACQQYRIGAETVSAVMLDNTKLANDEWIETIRDEFGIAALEELINVCYIYQSNSKRNAVFIK